MDAVLGPSRQPLGERWGFRDWELLREQGRDKLGVSEGPGERRKERRKAGKEGHTGEKKGTL